MLASCLPALVRLSSFIIYRERTKQNNWLTAIRRSVFSVLAGTVVPPGDQSIMP